MTDNDNGIKNVYDETSDVDDLDTKVTLERRDSKRFKKVLSARIENDQCTVLNISNKGVLLQTCMPVYLFPLDKTIDFGLQIDEEWLTIKGKIMWIQSDILHSKIGLSIQDAPLILS